MQVVSGGGIKSIARGSSTIAVSGTTTNVTIASVNMAKTEVRFLGSGYAAATIKLNNSTQIQISRGTAETTATTVNWELTEWY